MTALASLAVSAAWSSDDHPLPRVSLVIPADVSSEKIEISYFMSGPFGGYGGSLPQEPNLHTLIVNASVDAVAAKRIRIIAYVPGCEFTTFDIELAGAATVERRLNCRRLPTVALSGQVGRELVPAGKSADVEIVYIANWAHPFFGVTDGMVPMFHVAAAVPDGSGRFRANLPDLLKDPVVSSVGNGRSPGGFQLLLRDKESGNILGFLQPTEYESPENYLLPKSEYRNPILFNAVPR